jgi:hypothetical protein
MLIIVKNVLELESNLQNVTVQSIIILLLINHVKNVNINVVLVEIKPIIVLLVQLTLTEA